MQDQTTTNIIYCNVEVSSLGEGRVLVPKMSARGFVRTACSLTFCMTCTAPADDWQHFQCSDQVFQCCVRSGDSCWFRSPLVPDAQQQRWVCFSWFSGPCGSLQEVEMTTSLCVNSSDLRTALQRRGQCSLAAQLALAAVQQTTIALGKKCLCYEKRCTARLQAISFWKVLSRR